VRGGRLQDIYWTYSYSPIYESDGVVAGIAVVFQDDTRQVVAERELRESEVLSSRILQSIGDAVIVTDAETRIMRMNPIAQQLTGWNAAEAKGQPLSSVFHLVNESTRQIVESPSDKVKRLGTVVGLENHTVLIAKDGTETSIDDSGAPIRNDEGQLIGTVLVFRDINERRLAERERNAITEQLDQVLNATTDAVVSVNRDWVMTYTNPKAEQIYASSGAILGKNLWERFPGAIYEGSPYTEHYYRAMNEGAAGQFEAYYPEPLKVWLSIMVYPTKDGIVIFSRNITEQRRAATALIHNEKLAAVGRLAASIAHEINNPLESVTNLIYLARNSDDFTQIQEYLDTAERELRRVSVISNQTLRFYKQSSGPRAVTCDDLTGSVLAIHRGRIVSSRVEVETHRSAARSILCFDGEIRQVLNNLIGNAIDAMSSDGGRLVVRSREATDWSNGRKGLTITIADTGGGISSKNLKSIFEPFFTTKGAQGNGLGLWVSKEIVANHQGILRVRSSQREGHRGTVFTLFLPFDSASRDER
jgi:PAS domain S-box-containing protein